MKKIIFFVLLGLSPHSLWAASVYVFPVEGAVEQNLKNSVHALVKSAVISEPGYTLVEDIQVADVQLSPKILQLGASYLVTVDKSAAGRFQHSTKMKSATVEDLDTVTGRAVRAALRGVGAKESARVDEVTEDEVTRGSRRTLAVGQWKFGLGPAWAEDMNVKGTGTHMMLGYSWSIDPLWDLNLAWRYTTFSKSGESGASMNDLQIGASYLFSPFRTAPYVSLGFGRGIASVSSNDTGLFKFSSDRANGWSGHVSAGYRFFRTSNVNFAIEANYSRIFSNSSGSGASPAAFDTAFIILF